MYILHGLYEEALFSIRQLQFYWKRNEQKKLKLTFNLYPAVPIGKFTVVRSLGVVHFHAICYSLTKACGDITNTYFIL